MLIYKDYYFSVFMCCLRGRGTGDFEVSRHVSKQIGIAQKIYTRGE